MLDTSIMSLSSYDDVSIYDDGRKDIDPSEVDKMLADELNQLSFTDRERVMDEVHGIIANPTYPSSEEEELLLLALQQELDTYYYDINNNANNANNANDNNNNSINSNSNSNINGHGHNKRTTLYPAYQEARSNNSALLVDREFCRSFLVAGDYDPKKACIRYLCYLELICKIYNTSKVLYRPILLDDIHDDAKEQLAQGSWQILPDRDTSGRRIFVYLRDLDSSLPRSLWTQVFVYMTQQFKEKGPQAMISVVFLHNSALFSKMHANNQDEISRRVMDAVPTRYSAIHLCFPDAPFSYICKSAILLSIGKENRSRVRFHIGSITECHYSLKSFGIQVHRLPIVLELNTSHRKDNITEHTKWLRMQSSKEDYIRNIDINYGMDAVNYVRLSFIECPYHEDCLFGRGREVMKHAGNVAMRRLIDERREQYNAAMHSCKSKVAREVVSEIKSGGGRFLRKCDNGTGLYTLVDDETAVKKVLIAFRDWNTKQSASQQKRVHGDLTPEEEMEQENQFVLQSNDDDLANHGLYSSNHGPIPNVIFSTSMNNSNNNTATPTAATVTNGNPSSGMDRAEIIKRQRFSIDDVVVGGNAATNTSPTNFGCFQEQSGFHNYFL